MNRHQLALAALLIAILVFPVSEYPASAAADGVTVKPKLRGRCVSVSNGRHRVRINCGTPKTHIELGNFPFGVSIGDTTESGAVPRRRTGRATSPAPAEPDILSEAELIARYDTNGNDLVDCGDFDTQAEAQAAYGANPSDPFGIDGPAGTGRANAGIYGRPCEHLP